MAERIMSLKKETDIQVQESDSANKMNPKRLTPNHIMIKMTKGKENPKGSKRKTESHMQGNQLLANFSEENLQARGDWHDIFKVLKGKT